MTAIETRKLTKKFGDFTANNEIDIRVERGEIKAVVGENGAGKSTLMNMLYGLLQPSSGEILVDGEPVRFASPSDAIKRGIGMVHQHFKLSPNLTVFENVVLGSEIRRAFAPLKPLCLLPFVRKRPALNDKFAARRLPLPLIDAAAQKAAVERTIQKYNLGLDAAALVKNLSIGEKQRVEILKMLYRDVQILILDEPTGVLTPREADELISSLKELRRGGKTVIVITHKLREVMDASDSVTVIRGGAVVGEAKTFDTDEKKLARMMVGRDIERPKTGGAPVAGGVVYEVKNLSVVAPDGRKAVDGVSFNIRAGEILGVAGVEGNGQSELVKALTGLMTVAGGTVLKGGADITDAWPKAVRENKIAVIPEDRYGQGLCRDMTVAQNAIAGYHRDRQISRFGLLSKKAVIRRRDGLVKNFDVRLCDPDGDVSQLSGGNAQKLIVARELSSNPDVLIASQPTRGVDVGSIEFIHKKLLELKDAGKAVLLVSSELSEIMNLSDRVIVMYKGAVVGEAPRGADGETLGLMMAGVMPGGG
ncbi:MAG: ABC transporter ATP-binding protein [Clostridiales bacterium]|jgi:simple sugar transport system ATP-binding protein|nr:ABC transporter ATP-binding protein [Clostridiales bacterium]